MQKNNKWVKQYDKSGKKTNARALGVLCTVFLFRGPRPFDYSCTKLKSTLADEEIQKR